MLRRHRSTRLGLRVSSNGNDGSYKGVAPHTAREDGVLMRLIHATLVACATVREDGVLMWRRRQRHRSTRFWSRVLLSVRTVC